MLFFKLHKVAAKYLLLIGLLEVLWIVDSNGQSEELQWTDSVVFNHKNTELKLFPSPFSDLIQLTFEDTSFCTRLSSFGAPFGSNSFHLPPKGCFAKNVNSTVDSVVFPGENCEVLRKIYYPKTCSEYGYYYRPFVIDQRSLAFQNDSTVWIYLLYSSHEVVQTYEDYLTANSRYKIGRFRIKKDTLELVDMLDMKPNAGFLGAKYPYLMIYPSMITDKNSLFLGFNFLDTIYQFDYTGNLTTKIPLPEEVEYIKYHRMEGDGMSYKDVRISEHEGSQNVNILYDPKTDHLVIITVDGNPEARGREGSNEFDEKDWRLSIYDMDSGGWVSTHKFDNEHSFRNVLMYDGRVFVKRVTGERVVFDIYRFD